MFFWGEEMKNRIEWIDNLKGFGIILMVWGHFYPPLGIKEWIYSFHMPLFFFLSGYLRNKRSINQTFKQKSSTILKPYLIAAAWSFPIGFIRDPLFGISSSFLDHIKQFLFWDGTVGWNSPIWFLLVLFLVEVTYVAVDNFKLNTTISVLIIWILGLFIYKAELILPFGLHLVTWVIIYYHVGVILRKWNVIDKLSNYWVLISILFVASNACVNIFYNQQVNELYHGILGNYFVFFINAIIMIIALLLVFSKTREIRLFKTISNKSIFIITTHYLIYYALFTFDSIFLGVKLFNYTLLPSLMTTTITFISYFLFYKYFSGNLENIYKKLISNFNLKVSILTKK